MTIDLIDSEQRIVLDNISWDLYEGLLTAHRDRRVPRFTYDRGCLEIVSPSAEHERITERIALLVNLVAEVKGINVAGYGSTTFRREDLAKGFEPDTCFYGKNLHGIQGKTALDLRIDPPPDLVIEIDYTSSSLDKVSITAEVGVPELWRYDATGWRILVPHDGEYAEQLESFILPGLSVKMISRLIEDSRTLEPLAWMARVRAAVQTPQSGGYVG